MDFISNTITALADTRKHMLSTPKFVPAGQSTQVIIGATDESDLEIIHTADRFYRGFNLKRVYYSGYVPVLADERLPSLSVQVPLLRENRLYQADWLMRFYGFGANEILDPHAPFLDLDIDPKFSWALRNLHLFPLDVNTADLEMILRVPGIGVRSAQKIVAARKFSRLGWETLRKLGISLNRARYFIVCKDTALETKEYAPETLRHLVLSNGKSKFNDLWGTQTSLFG